MELHEVSFFFFVLHTHPPGTRAPVGARLSHSDHETAYGKRHNNSNKGICTYDDASRTATADTTTTTHTNAHHTEKKSNLTFLTDRLYRGSYGHARVVR